MKRKREPHEQLFYGVDEIARPAYTNFYVRLQEAVGDWQALAEPLEPAFSDHCGRPTDPVVYLKAYLVGYLENITYDTDLAERIADSFAIRRFLGYNLAERTPDHSSLSRNRARIGAHCDIEEVLSRVVGLCAEAGLVQGELVAVDSSLVAANASLSSLRSVRTGKSVREHLAQVRQANAQAAQEESASIDELSTQAHTSAAPCQSSETTQPPAPACGAQQEHLPEPVAPTKKQAKLEVSNAEFRSSTDPDARIATKPGTPTGMYYKATHVTDSAHGIILGAGCAPADVADTAVGLPVLEQAQENLAQAGKQLGTLVADSAYDDADFHADVERMGATPITNYTPDTTSKPDAYKKAAFVYVQEADCYICPQGALMRCGGVQEDRIRYVSERARCEGCAGRAHCLGKGQVRYIYRHCHEDARERNIARCHSDAGRGALRARRTIAEPPFGHMKTYGGLGRINCRSDDKATVKIVLAAVAWDLIKLVGARAQAQRAEQAQRAAQQAQALSYALCCLLWLLLGCICVRLAALGRARAAMLAPCPPHPSLSALGP